MTQPLLCVYHALCDDGFGAAWSVRHAVPDAQFFAAYHSGKVPNVRGRDVVFVDFCYPAKIMDKIVAEAKSVLVLDHHKSTMEDITAWAKTKKALFVTDPNGTLGIQLGTCSFMFDMSRSGAMMAWNHYHPGQEAPRFIHYIQDRDLWTNRLPQIKEFTAGLRSYPMEFEVWDLIFGFNPVAETLSGQPWAVKGAQDKMVDNIIREGIPVERYKRQLVEAAVKNSFWVEINVPAPVDQVVNHPEQLDGLYYNTVRIRGANVLPAIVSEVGEELALRYGGQSLTWCEGGKNWNYQLRSRDLEGGQPVVAGSFVEAPDVSKIAVAFGGGGHHRAAGFKSVAPVHKKWVAPEPEEDEPF